MGHPNCPLCQHGPNDLSYALVWERAGKTCSFHRSADYLTLQAVADAAQAVLDNRGRPWLELTTEGERYLGAMVHIFVAQGWWEALKDALAALRVEKEGA